MNINIPIDATAATALMVRAVNPENEDPKKGSGGSNMTPKKKKRRKKK